MGLKVVVARPLINCAMDNLVVVGRPLMNCPMGPKIAGYNINKGIKSTYKPFFKSIFKEMG